ncbi:MAG: F0F1 ATP synthase subunit A [Bdellovibrionales bacterium]|jgi:F-type H+-transporting ATPase subunit a|nr:F0F1 ATP synthase subunit A [Bdellovibrionales bacterium]
MSFNWFQLVPGVVGPEGDYTHVATLTATVAASVVLGSIARNQLKTGEDAAKPTDRFSIRGIFEIITDFVSKLAHQVIGHHYQPYVPFFSAMFFFILFNNLVGILPGMTPATENINTTFAFGIFSFMTYNFIGLKKGGTHYLAHFLGPIWWLAPLMLIIELISHMIRPLTLGMRMANVLTGDHTALMVFLDLVPFLVPIPLYALSLIVAFIQAFVFTLLSMVYVSLATASDH